MGVYRQNMLRMLMLVKFNYLIGRIDTASFSRLLALAVGRLLALVGWIEAALFSWLVAVERLLHRLCYTLNCYFSLKQRPNIQ